MIDKPRAIHAEPGKQAQVARKSKTNVFFGHSLFERNDALRLFYSLINLAIWILIYDDPHTYIHPITNNAPSCSTKAI